MSDYNITDLLSPAFLERMQKMLGDEYEDFIKSYEAPRTYGLRVNTAKISCEEFEKIVPFPVTPIPWIPNGYFYPGDVRPSFCPLYQSDFSPLNLHGCPTENSNMRLSAF